LACREGRPSLSQDQDRRLFSESAGTCLLCSEPLFTDLSEGSRSISIAERAHIIAHSDQTGDPHVYWTQIHASLAGVSVSQISRQLGVSLASASKMRAGSLLPHVRHWEALRALPTKR
jgi:hypothetical protein